MLTMVWNAHIPIQNMKGCIYYLHTRHRWKSDIQTLLMNTLIVVYRCKSYHHIIMATETPQYLIVKLNILHYTLHLLKYISNKFDGDCFKPLSMPQSSWCFIFLFFNFITDSTEEDNKWLYIYSIITGYLIDCCCM